MKSPRNARRALLPLALCLVACDEPASPTSAASAAPAASVAAAPASVIAPQPAAAVAPPAKPKKKLEDCPKGAQVSFDVPAIEQAVRDKLPKKEGTITKADLSRLRSLNLSQLELSELDICLFSAMTGLKELALGRGSYDDLSPIAGATKLESLRASISQVRDLSPLSKMTKMDRLDLGRTQVADLAPLAAMTELTELQLDDTPVDDVTVLAKLTKLQNLSIKRTRVKDVSALKPLKKLKFLYVNGAPVDENPMGLGAVRANGTKVISE
jgi:internalin A